MGCRQKRSLQGTRHQNPSARKGRPVPNQTRGAILRSKARWYNEGEKNTK